MEKKIHTTNYTNTLIEPAEDCPVSVSTIPPDSEKPIVARQQYDLLASNDYKYSSDEVLFRIYALRNDITESEWQQARENFFSKGQACFRASPLTKRFGWAIHSDSAGKIALVSTASAEYQKLQANEKIKKVKAMKLKR
jgi:hypothetical protein